MERRRAEFCFDERAGFHAVPVIVIGETPTRYRIEAIRPMRLAGRNRSLAAGETALVPRTAVRFLDPHAPTGA